MPEINIESRYVDTSQGRLITAFLENELDYEHVSVSRNSMAVKAILPIEIVIIATSVFFLNKFILEPLLGHLSDKWKEKIWNLFKKEDSFNLTVHISEENFSIEAPLGNSHEITAGVWGIIHQSIEIIKRENLQGQISTIRFLPDYEGKLVVFCIKNEKDVVLIDLESSKTKQLERGHLLLLEESNN